MGMARVRLEIDLGVGLTGGQGVHPSETEVAGSVAAVLLRFMPFDDRERGVDVADFVRVGDAVELEIQGIQFGSEVVAPMLIPPERR